MGALTTLSGVGICGTRLVEMVGNVAAHSGLGLGGAPADLLGASGQLGACHGSHGTGGGEAGMTGSHGLGPGNDDTVLEDSLELVGSRGERRGGPPSGLLGAAEHPVATDAGTLVGHGDGGAATHRTGVAGRHGYGLGGRDPLLDGGGDLVVERSFAEVDHRQAAEVVQGLVAPEGDGGGGGVRGHGSPGIHGAGHVDGEGGSCGRIAAAVPLEGSSLLLILIGHLGTDDDHGGRGGPVGLNTPLFGRPEALLAQGAEAGGDGLTGGLGLRHHLGRSAGLGLLGRRRRLGTGREGIEPGVVVLRDGPLDDEEAVGVDRVGLGTLLAQHLEGPAPATDVLGVVLRILPASSHSSPLLVILLVLLLVVASNHHHTLPLPLQFLPPLLLLLVMVPLIFLPGQLLRLGPDRPGLGPERQGTHPIVVAPPTRLGRDMGGGEGGGMAGRREGGGGIGEGGGQVERRAGGVAGVGPAHLVAVRRVDVGVRAGHHLPAVGRLGRRSVRTTGSMGAGSTTGSVGGGSGGGGGRRRGGGGERTDDGQRRRDVPGALGALPAVVMAEGIHVHVGVHVVEVVGVVGGGWLGPTSTAPAGLGGLARLRLLGLGPAADIDIGAAVRIRRWAPGRRQRGPQPPDLIDRVVPVVLLLPAGGAPTAAAAAAGTGGTGGGADHAGWAEGNVWKLSDQR